jgi:hydrogenase maturation protease
VLVLGLGNPLLSDDGAGLVLLERVRDSGDWSDRVEWVDGGTQGIALLGVLSGRRIAIILDAVESDEPPGTVHVWGMDRPPPTTPAPCGCTPAGCR